MDGPDCLTAMAAVLAAAGVIVGLVWAAAAAWRRGGRKNLRIRD